MAGYMTKMHGRIYEGEFVNGAAAPVANGTLMVLGADGRSLVLPAADTTSKFLCKEVTTIYDGITAYRMVANKLNANYYFVENLPEINDSEAYDVSEVLTPVGKYLRAHPVLTGEEFVATNTATLTAGSLYGVKATGLVG